MKRILFQLDTDPIPSTFDRVVAVDAGADEVFALGGVTADNVVPLVHGAIFTRGINDLKNTAIFIGGSDVQAAEKVFQAVKQTFFGPMQVSVMLDPSGSATTAAAAVRSAAKHISLKDAQVLILGGTGPVGQRTALILASQGAHVRIASRSLQRAEATAALIRTKISGAKVSPCDCNDDGLAAAVDKIEVLVAAGAAGVSFLTADEWQSISTLKVAVDLNAIPPLGLSGIEPNDRDSEKNGIAVYGALGIGGFKMKIHKAAINKLFSTNDLVLNTEAIYTLSGEIDTE